jgi:hypothetical protein
VLKPPVAISQSPATNVRIDQIRSRRDGSIDPSKCVFATIRHRVSHRLAIEHGPNHRNFVATDDSAAYNTATALAQTTRNTTLD